MVQLLIAAAIAAAMPAAPFPNDFAAQPGTEAPAPEQAKPAMFMVGDGDTKIYLFGTFHALDGEGHWFDAEVRDAFEQSDELVLETLVPERPRALRRLARLPAPQVAPSASFLASTKLAIDAGKSQGMQVDNGADMVLRHAAETEGKGILGLETIESQLAMFSKMPAPVPPQDSRGAPAAPPPELQRAMAAMQSAWKHGEQGIFVAMLDQLNAASPNTYKMLFKDRNARWADWVAARLQTPGTVFVAVGAGHLAGRDSLLVRLAQRGIGSRRVN